MPTAAPFRIAVLEELFRQLSYAPSAARQRHMDAAEALIADIDPERTYPEEFIIFRITGYRPESEGEEILVVGEPLRADLSSFVQRVSYALDLQTPTTDRRPMEMAEVAGRLNVAPRSIQRYRRLGLACHYVRRVDGAKRLMCYEDALQRFMTAHQQSLVRAANFSRMPIENEAKIIDQARDLRKSEAVSLNEAARRLAKKHNRVRETVRGILRRHDRQAEEPIFSERGPLTARERRVIERAWQWGVAAAEIGRRFGRSRAAIQRVVNQSRLAYLSTIDLSHVELPTLAMDEADQVILAAPAARENLIDTLPQESAVALIEASRDSASSSEEEEQAMIAAFNLLKRRTARSLQGQGEWPRAGDLDTMETDLRWAALLKRRLVSLAFPAAVVRIEQNLHAPLLDQPSEVIRRLVGFGISQVSRVVEHLDPSRGQHLQRVTALELDRHLPGLDLPSAAGRAAARHEKGSIALTRPFDESVDWWSRLSLRPDLVALVPRLDAALRIAIEQRFGLTGSPPLTWGQLGRTMNCSPRSAMQRVNRARGHLRRIVIES